MALHWAGYRVAPKAEGVKAPAPVEDGATHADADALIRTMIALLSVEMRADLLPSTRAWYGKAMDYAKARGDKSLRPAPKRPYCAVICHGCKNIIGWEAPEPLTPPGEAK